MRNSIASNKCACILLLLFILVVIASCGKNSVVTTASSPFSNIPKGTGATPEPGTDGKPIPYPYGHSESMVASNGVDFVGSDNGKIYAFNGMNGNILWQNNTGNAVDVFAVENGTVYAYANSDSSGVMYALAANNGNIIWHYRVNDTISGVLSGSVLYVTTAATGNKAVLYALQAANGSLIWRYNAHTTMPGLLAANDGIVYYAEVAGDSGSNANENITAFQGDNGHVLWRLHTVASDGIISGISAPADGVIYLSTNSGAAYAVRVSDGALLWHVARVPGLGSPPVPASVAPLVSNGVVYVSGKQEVGNGMQTLYALRASDGTQVWSKAVNGSPAPVAAQPLLVNGVLYLDNADGVSALRATDGAALWQNQGNNAAGPLIALNGLLYVNSWDGVFVVRANDGALLWKQNVPNHNTEMSGLTPEAVAGTIVYVASEDGVVEALNASNGRLLWRYAIQEKGQPTGTVDGATLTFTPSTSYQQALRMITDMGLQTADVCAFSWKPQSTAADFSGSHTLFVSSTVGAAPLWLYRLKASPDVASVDVQNSFSCPAERANQPPSYIAPGQVGTYVRVTFSSANYDAALYAANNLGFRLANPCYERARARGSKPTWSLMGQETTFAQTRSLLLATTSSNATTWRSQLQALPGVTKIETPFHSSC